MSNVNPPYSQDHPADRVDHNRNFQIVWENGQNVLYFKNQELRLLGDRKDVHFENGVLLVFDVLNKTTNKHMQSYSFYNNNGKKVFGINNYRNSNEPEFWINVQVYKRKIIVKKFSYSTKAETEILYSVSTCQKIDNDEQFSFNF